MKVIRKKKPRGGSAAGIIAAVSWYCPEEWAKLLEVSVDRDELEQTYEEWLPMAENGLLNLEKVGITPKRVYVKVDKLVEWCRSQNRPVDGAARSEFAAFLLQEEASGE